MRNTAHPVRYLKSDFPFLPSMPTSQQNYIMRKGLLLLGTMERPQQKNYDVKHRKMLKN